ncbi:glycosyltransferase [Acidiphilium sp. PA]|uniref:glycosyltransferase n=1 Tax=Acidiphilium sp. PA TaxID=2871705 RepID=UPI002244CBA7|nr:glycosyltransferase [Acidiphilium sp. PA]MCW8308622.1 glycosyltransferase [Acidiphilium sp. PA]
MNAPFDDATPLRTAPEAGPPVAQPTPQPASVMIFLPALTIGGAEVAMVRLAGAFATAGHRVAIVVQAPVTGAAAIAVPPCVELMTLDVRHTWTSPSALARYAVTWQADALIAALPHNNLAAIAAGLIVRIKHGRHLVVVVTEHAPMAQLIAAHASLRYRILPLLQRACYPMAAALVCASSGIAAEFRALLPAGTAIHTIFNPVVAAGAIPVDDLRRTAADRPALIVAAGRLAPEKDLSTLLRAFARLRAHRQARLIIAGEGPERAGLTALAGELGIAGDVEMPGFSTNLPALLAKADVFVTTSRFEGFGNVIVEALASGTKIVATDCPVGPREILADGAFGTLVPVGDAAAIAVAIDRTLDDCQNRADLRRRAADFTIDASLNAYRALIDSHRPPAHRRAAPLTLAIYMHDFSSGGVEHATLSLIGAFRAAGIAVTLLVHSDTGELRANLPPDLTVINFATPRTGADLAPLVRYLRTHRPDVLLANLDHNNLIATLASLIARIGPGKSTTRLIIAQHNALSAEARAMPGLKYRLLPIAYRLLAPHAAGIVAVSAGVADDLAACAGLDRNRITVINNPVVDATIHARATAPLDHPWVAEAATLPLFITAGRLVGQKDHATLLRAFARARTRRPMRLVILGEGPLRPMLEALADELGIRDALLMPGYVANPLPWFAAAAAFVLSSRYEGFGNVLVEAMVCGTPVISTDCPHGPAEILDHGRFGVLVQPGDVNGLAGALDPALRQRWSPDTLRSRADHYTAAASAQGYIALFDRVRQ